MYDTLITLPEHTPDALLAAKSYDADAIRADLAKRNIESFIPGRSNRRVVGKTIPAAARPPGTGMYPPALGRTHSKPPS